MVDDPNQTQGRFTNVRKTKADPPTQLTASSAWPTATRSGGTRLHVGWPRGTTPVCASKHRETEMTTERP